MREKYETHIFVICLAVSIVGSCLFFSIRSRFYDGMGRSVDDIQQIHIWRAERTKPLSPV